MGYRQVIIKKSEKINLKDNQLVIVKEDSSIKIPLEDINYVLLEDPQTTITARLLSELGKNAISLITCDETYNPTSITYSYNYHFKQLEVFNKQLELDNSVKDAKKQIKSKKDATEEEVSPLKDISKYSENVVKVDKKVVNEVPSYGTAFSPFFISIALWVGALMLYIILYFDKENRFEKLSIDNPNHLKRTFYYHVLGTMAGIILAFLLQVLLDFEITSIPLYYFSIVLIANTFVALIEFLILNFKDVGKFIALILLVLQLAAAGGTFPIETVTKSFRFLHPLLPMTYTIGLLRESLMTIEGSLLSKNLIIVISICLVFVVLNLVKDLRYEKNRRTGK